MAAEGMGYRRDDADFADTVVETVTACGLAASAWNFNQRPVFRHPAENLVKRNHGFGRPHAILLERHELDEPDDYALFAGKHPKRDDLVFVEAAHEDAIHLHRPEPRTAG